MTVPVSRPSLRSMSRPLNIGMQSKNPREELLIVPPVNTCYRFPYFIKGVPPHWKNPPPSVQLFDPFSTLKFRLKLRVKDKKRKKLGK